MNDVHDIFTKKIQRLNTIGIGLYLYKDKALFNKCISMHSNFLSCSND